MIRKPLSIPEGGFLPLWPGPLLNRLLTMNLTKKLIFMNARKVA